MSFLSFTRTLVVDRPYPPRYAPGGDEFPLTSFWLYGHSHFSLMFLFPTLQCSIFSPSIDNCCAGNREHRSTTAGLWCSFRDAIFGGYYLCNRRFSCRVLPRDVVLCRVGRGWILTDVHVSHETFKIGNTLIFVG